ncbi:hypothetical protein DIS24_g11862 [Lasiodiplodia hormozganensis]|uniref:Methyltransferase-like protein 13 n=1 Tax=Lasiodiplodia hormozganensis TaxID=869390 RepID=A0AA39WHB8_9PEZI|nr:hypothetical protein DIS24_g11862 [Lasiodiplodia hormozganensis]
MAKDPPPFAQPDYWDERFTKNPSAFEWLLPANCLDGPITEALSHASSPRPRLLHIGCGTSALSLHLRSHVENPRQIHNTDFSRVAVELGARWERDVFSATAREKAINAGKKDGSSEEHDCTDRMQWSTLDLLSLPSIRALAEEEGCYDIVVDKSTCDAISCGDDVPVALPHPLQPSPPPPSSSSSSTAKIHPLHILALHLAALVPPGGRWIALSYSGQRFPFFEPFPVRADEGSLDAELLERGFVHPGRLWRLERKEMVEVGGEGAKPGGGGLVHEPRTAHWIYVMVRSELELVGMPLQG